MCKKGLATQQPRARSILSALAVSLLALTPVSFAAGHTSAAEHSELPSGTILPVILRTSISPQKTKPGDIVHGSIAQDVPLLGGSKIPKGARIEGKILEVQLQPAPGQGATVSFRFDQLRFHRQHIAVTTDLRAIAGFVEVLQAQIPNTGPGESDVYDWMTTTQIGGDSVFGVGGPVGSAHDTSETVGESLMTGGVLVRVSPNQAGGCRGAVAGNNNPQALWVFSSDACGTYGLSRVKIVHAGRTDPLGTVTLELRNHNTKIQNGAGLLLRVIG